MQDVFKELKANSKELNDLAAKAAFEIDRLQRRSRAWEDALEKIAELGHKLDFSAAEFAKSRLAEVRNADNTEPDS